MNNNDDDKVLLNGKEMKKEEFENERKSLLEKKIQIVEVAKNTFITRMLD